MKSLAYIMVLSSVGAAQAQSPPAAAPSRDASLINAFEVMCNLELPVFEHIDAHATAMKMVLKSDTTGPSAGDTTMHNKAWIGGLTTGPFFLFDDQLSGSKGVTTACAVGGDVSDPDAFRAEAIKELKLSGEPEPEFLPDGSRSYDWKGFDGPGTTLIVRDLTPSKREGVMMKLLSMVPKEPYKLK